MCMAVYIASDSPLTLVPWNEADPRFYVADLDGDDSAVRRHFAEAHVYYAGSHEGCGCGFQYGQYPEIEDEDRPRKRDSLNRFADYLDRETANVGTVHVFACWEGDQTAPPEHRRKLAPEDLRRDDFFFLEHELTTIEGKPTASD